jgi:hypothetical protein
MSGLESRRIMIVKPFLLPLPAVPGILFVLYLLENARGISRDNYTGRNILRYNAASADHRILAHGDPTE